MDESTKRGLLAAYGRLLRPLVRILIRNGVIYSEFAEVAKETFVRVAMEGTSSESLNEDSITSQAALEGISDAEQTKIMSAIRSSKPAEVSQSDLIVAVLATWHSNSMFTGPYGLPLELQLEDKSGIDFSNLVKITSPESDPKYFLSALIESKTVEETRPGWYRAKKRTYIPGANAPDFIEHLSSAIEDLANTLDHNHAESNIKNKMFQREVYTEEGIKESDIAAFANFAGQKGQTLIAEVDNWLEQLEKPTDSSEKKIRTGMSIFHYVRRESNN